ncbi:hypothetical protein OROHE_001361 [Orobanche hederae]
MEIVLVDKDGTRIQATVKGHIMDMFIDIIQEGQLLKIKQFSVNGSFKDEAPMFDIIGNIVDFNDTRMKDDVPIKGSRSVQLLLEDLETKAFRGEIGISNTYHATKVVVDPNLEEIVEFSNKLKKVTEKDAKFFCDKCGDYVVGNARFKIHVKVVDGKSNAVFLLWDDVARMLVGTSASEICERLVVKSFAKDDESGGSGKDVSRLEFPSEVDSLIERELLFKVGVESRHLEGRDHVYVVERVCDDASIVKMHKSIEHKINDFPTRPYKDIVGDTNWDSNPQDDDIDAEIEYKSPERVLGKRG